MKEISNWHTYSFWFSAVKAFLLFFITEIKALSLEDSFLDRPDVLSKLAL